jgi:hypothetical protein
VNQSTRAVRDGRATKNEGTKNFSWADRLRASPGEVRHTSYLRSSWLWRVRTADYLIVASSSSTAITAMTMPYIMNGRCVG